ncbi:MAG TPA: hypothetical protein PKM88_08715 [bacterium]|nr:hypothetical protein [bacterium]
MSRRVLLPVAVVLCLLLPACGGAPQAAAPPVGAPALDPLARPVQRDLAKPEEFLYSAGGSDYTVTKLADYSLCGIVVSVENYYIDAGAALAPVDIATVFGQLAANDLWRKISWSQHIRWYWWSYQYADIPGGNPFIVSNSSNNHIIPATPQLKAAARALQPGAVIQLTGSLVSIAESGRPDGFHWQSSVTRDDTGDGSCELIWLDELRCGQQVWR